MRFAGVTCVVLASCGRLDFEDRSADASRTYADAVMVDHPLAYWRFEDSGVTAVDELGTHPGTLEGDVARTPGLVGQGARFDGTTTRLVIGNAFPFPNAAPYSVELWVKPAVVDGHVTFLVDRVTDLAPSDGYAIYFDQDFSLQSRTHAGVEGGYGTGPGLVAGRFTYVVATYDGIDAAFYLDAGYQGGMGDSAQLVDGPGKLVFGDLSSGQFFKLSGVLDEVAIYGRALTQAQVAAHFAAAR